MGKITTFAVCEDDEKDMEKLLGFIIRWQENNGFDITKPLCFSHAYQLLASNETRKANALFLDIMMPGKTGTEPLGVNAAWRLRHGGYKGPIVFISSSDEYYPEGFEVDAAHYLIKPLSYENFCEAMRRVVKSVKRIEQFIRVPVSRMQMRIPLSGLIYAEVYGHQTQFVTIAGTHVTTLSLNEVERMLGGTPFLRCYRSYIVNMDYIERMEENRFLMTGGSRVPITLRNVQAVREQYLSYCLIRMREEDRP